MRNERLIYDRGVESGDAVVHRPAIISVPHYMESLRGRSPRRSYNSDRSLSRSASPQYRQEGPSNRTVPTREFSPARPRPIRNLRVEDKRDFNLQSQNRFQGKPNQNILYRRPMDAVAVTRDPLVGNNSRSRIDRVNLNASQPQSRIINDRNSKKTKQASPLAHSEKFSGGGFTAAGTKPPLDERINITDHNESTPLTPPAVQRKGANHGKNQASQSPSSSNIKRMGRNNRNPVAVNLRLASNSQKSIAKSLEDRIS